MSAYYNEIDPYAAQWLRNLIAAGHIAPGVVDERSILDVQAADLAEYTQCHFFAGIGVWSYALRLAGWPDDRPVWTGSCPCQPFSAVGKGEGATDPRHLWPAWFRLINERRPVVVFGEQVGAAIRHGWLDLVSSDLEGLDYAVGAAVVGAHSVGAPHIRQRLFFVGHATESARERDTGEVLAAEARLDGARIAVDGSLPVGSGDASPSVGAGRDGGSELAARTSGIAGVTLGDAASIGQSRGRQRDGSSEPGERHAASERPAIREQAAERCIVDERVDDAASARQQPTKQGPESEARNETWLRGFERGRGSSFWRAADWRGSGSGTEGMEQRLEHGGDGDCGVEHAASEQVGIPRRARQPRESFWSRADWLDCIDGKARPVEPGTFPLAHGVTARVGRLRAYGNAIVAPLAAEFIRAYLG